MTSRLATLRSQLAGLRRARAAVRAATAWSALGIALLLAVAAIFALDVALELPAAQRGVLLLLASAALAWAFWRFTRPLIGFQETEIDMALLVERQQEIDSDLVAALQFEQPEAARWGSPQLEVAVIDYVAAVGRGIDVYEGFDRRQMTRRLTALGVGLAVALAVTAIWPGHVRAFLNRLALGSMHYPTATRIEQILVNRTPVLERAAQGSAPQDANAAQGRPLMFLVACSGDLPLAGTVRLAALGGSRARTQLALKALSLDERRARLLEAQSAVVEASQQPTLPVAAPWRAEMLALVQFDAPQAAREIAAAKTQGDLAAARKALEAALADWPAERTQIAVLAGELPRLNESVSYKLLAGDAWTDPADVAMIPLPIVELRATPTPPKYARDMQPPADDRSRRQIAVLEGSSVALELECTNGKPLESAWLTIQTKSESKRFDLAGQGSDKTRWSLPSGPSPLANIREEVRYEAQVIDADGLSLETPIRGTIRIRPDRPPTGLAEVVHKVVLPTATPIIEYRASDDYGIGRLSLVAEIERGAAAKPNAEEADDGAAAGGSVVAAETAASDLAPGRALPMETRELPLIDTSRPITGDGLPLVGKHRLALQSLNLSKGDRVKLALVVTDYRGYTDKGEFVGQSYTSDPLVLEISDESGVLAAISEADQRSEERLTDIIKRQLGIGEAP